MGTTKEYEKATWGFVIISKIFSSTKWKSIFTYLALAREIGYAFKNAENERKQSDKIFHVLNGSHFPCLHHEKPNLQITTHK